jgi:hypothetical protein
VSAPAGSTFVRTNPVVAAAHPRRITPSLRCTFLNICFSLSVSVECFRTENSDSVQVVILGSNLNLHST